MRTLLFAGTAFALATAGCGHDTKGETDRACHDDDAPCGELELVRKSFYEDNPTYQDPTPDDGSFQTSDPAAEGLDPVALERGARELDANSQVFSFLLLRHDKLVVERYFHGSASTHANNIQSASKGLLAMLTGIALQEGRLRSLDAPLAELLPRFRLEGRKAGITLGHLLTMTGGFQWEEDETEYRIERKSNWVQAILDLPLQTAPGTAFNYSTGQSHLLSAVLTEATGVSVQDYAQRTVLAPLGIHVPHWGSDPQGYQSGGYNLYMTARSLTKLALLASHGGRHGDRQLVPEAWIADAMKPQAPVDDDWRYGYYWWLTTLGGHPVQKLWGYGGQLAYLIPDLDLIAVLTTNTKDDFEELDGDAFLLRHVIPAVVRASTPRSAGRRSPPEIR